MSKLASQPVYTLHGGSFCPFDRYPCLALRRHHCANLSRADSVVQMFDWPIVPWLRCLPVAETKNHWARDDPGFAVLQAFFLVVSDIFYAHHPSPCAGCISNLPPWNKQAKRVAKNVLSVGWFRL